MPRHQPHDFMDPVPTSATAGPAIVPGAFVLCPVVLFQACPLHQCLCQGVYQLAFQQALQHCAPPRQPRFSWN